MRIVSKDPQSPHRHGFALIVTISMMILLALLAVGLLSLSTVALRGSNAQSLQLEARQNARMALVMAIGELQKSCGPDQRVTAPAGIRGETTAQKHLTGVWEGWKWDGLGSTPDYSDKKQSQFVRWLVSTSDPKASEAIDFPDSKPTSNLVTLVGEKLVADDLVQAERVMINSSSQSANGSAYAWAVFDESTKVPLALPEPERGTTALAAAQSAAAPLPGYAAVTERNWGPLAELEGERNKLISTNQAELIGLATTERSFHSLTPRSAGVIADAGNGGLSVDLSRLFDDPNNLPTAYANRFLYSGTDAPIAAASTRFNGANPFPSPDPSWPLLHSHYRLYDKLSAGPSPSIATTSVARPTAETAGRSVLRHPFFNNQQIAPVLAKAQFVFSISFGYHSALTASAASNNNSKPRGQKDEFVTWLVIDPVITLWNPYNVNLRFTGARIDLFRVPLAFRLYKNGTLINSEYTHLANTFLNSDFNNRKETFYRLNLLPDQGDYELVMAPGEHIVFTAHNHVKHYNHEYMNKGLDMRPGFFPPAGNSSNQSVGGTSTLNVCVSPTGSPSGRDYGKAVRTIAVKPGDQIQVEITPQRAEIDKPKETGGREVSGFLKYYVGNPNRPSLVGGIEFDYGDKETTYLNTIKKEDLPTFLVSNDIPRQVKADDYQGKAPPVAVRFKEPFTIATFQLKTERDSKFPSRGWLQNSPTNLYSSAGLDQKEPWQLHQHELQWEAMYDWPPSSPTIEISNNGNRGYGGPGIYAQSGVEFATHSSIPIAPALSIPQLRHAPLNHSGQLPLTSQVVANSFACPLIPSDRVLSTEGASTYVDHSFLANAALFDHAFFSGLAEPAGPLTTSSSSSSAGVNDSLTAFLKQGTPLTNPRFVPYLGGQSADEIIEEITEDDGYLKTAAHLLIDSPLNVNTTNVDVWEAFLSSTFGTDALVSENGTLDTIEGKDVLVTRHLPSPGNDLESQVDPLSNDLAKWNGHRRLQPEQIRELAVELVEEIRKRGPFQSLSEFINRRPESGELGRSGALQAALDRTSINGASADTSSNVDGSGLPNPEAGKGNTADGAPGILTQADLLTPISPTLVARGDTFRVRAYGEAGPGNGNKVVAWCEAIVQRVPQYIDSADKPWDEPKADINLRFGRRFEVVSFRWLSPTEI
jgi:hypothetical protein